MYFKRFQSRASKSKPKWPLDQGWCTQFFFLGIIIEDENSQITEVGSGNNSLLDIPDTKTETTSSTFVVNPPESDIYGLELRSYTDTENSKTGSASDSDSKTSETGKTVIPFNVYVITEKAYSHLNAVGG